MSATTYLGTAALEQLDQAQADVNQHVAAGVDGRCLACGEVQPCNPLQRASSTFFKYGRLPARTPGLASRGVAEREAFGWFAR